MSIYPRNKVVLTGLKSAAMNGQTGETGAALNANGRWPVTLDGTGKTVAIKPDNLKRPPAAAASAAEGDDEGPGGKKTTLVRDNKMLKEFDDSTSPDLLALYFHYKDQAFDCFNADEYEAQLVQYYAKGISVVLVVPRSVRGNDYFLVGLQHAQHELNSLCQVAFQCKRQFCGMSMLVKKNCFLCNKPAKMRCIGCQCVCYCSKECQSASWHEHKKLCKLVNAGSITTEEEVVEIEV